MEDDPTEEMCIAGEEAYWSAPKDEDRCTAMAAAYRAMRAAAAQYDADGIQERIRGMLKMAVASEDGFNRLSPAGYRLIKEAEGFFASNREDRNDLQVCWDALQAETKRADAAEARLANQAPYPSDKTAIDRVARALHISCSKQDIHGYLDAKIDCTVLAEAALAALDITPLENEGSTR